MRSGEAQFLLLLSLINLGLLGVSQYEEGEAGVVRSCSISFAVFTGLVRFIGGQYGGKGWGKVRSG